jgi:predicted Ser/Thr protein kinase
MMEWTAEELRIGTNDKIVYFNWWQILNSYIENEKEKEKQRNLEKEAREHA